VKLRGQLTATDEDAQQGRFTLRTPQLDADVAIDVGGSSLQMYLDGCVGHEPLVTMEPQ
jgi:hypothetical protein